MSYILYTTLSLNGKLEIVVFIVIQFSQKLIPNNPIKNKPALV